MDENPLYKDEYYKLSKIVPETYSKFSFKGQCRLCRVKGVYDGDTIEVVTRLGKEDSYYTFRVRLSGIDTPELKGSTMPYGVHVRNLLSEAISGKIVEIQFSDKEDKYGRLLGEVYLIEMKRWGYFCCTQKELKRGFSVNVLLKRAGLCVDYKGDKKLPFAEAHLKSMLNVKTIIPT